MKTKNPLILATFLGLTLVLAAFALPQILSKKQNTPSPTLTTSNASQNGITINARGTNNKEKIALYINNTPVTFWNLSNNFQDYTYTPNTQVTINELSVHFLNDTWLPEQNINYDVQIPHITVNGERYNSEHQSTVSTGSWDQDSWCAPGNKQTQWLHCNGSFTYDVPQGTVVGLPQEPVTFVVESHTISNITSNSADIEFTASDVAQAYVEYGTTTSYGRQTPKESRFNWATHNQQLTGLQADTKYYYRINVTNRTGTTAAKTGSFTTAEGSGNGGGPVTPVTGWDDSQPNGGRAIGVVTYGITTGNNKLVAHKHSRRFLATRSGEVKAFRWVNRVLLAYDIRNRAETSSLDIWREVLEAVGDDPKRGGYMLSNSYSVGNGGLQEVSLVKDKNGLPSEDPADLIAIADPLVPFDLPLGKVVGTDFKQPGNVEAGQLYHLVFNNLNPPNTKLYGMSAQEARNAPIDKGAIALDGPKGGTALDPTEKQGPFMRDFPASFTKASATSSWRPSDVTPWYSLVYSDDIEVGEMYAHIHGQGEYSYYVEGNNKLRQEFTWDRSNVSVDRIVTRFAHKTSANGQPMNIAVKNQSGNTIATASVPFDAALRSAAGDDDYWKQHQTRHAVSLLSNAVTLVEGHRYYIEYTAASGAGFRMSPALDVINTRHGSNDWTVTWGKDARAMHSTDGTNWKGLSAFVDSDLAMYLIPVGVPTQTPRP